jgi:hypothetical protein
MKLQHNGNYASGFVYEYTNDIPTAKLVVTPMTTLQMATLEAIPAMTPMTTSMAITQSYIYNFMATYTRQKVSSGLGRL